MILNLTAMPRKMLHLFLIVLFAVQNFSLTPKENAATRKKLVFMSMRLNLASLDPYLSSVQTLYFYADYQNRWVINDKIILNPYAFDNTKPDPKPVVISQLVFEPLDKSYSYKANNEKRFSNYEISIDQIKEIKAQCPTAVYLIFKPYTLPATDQDYETFKNHILYEIIPANAGNDYICKEELKQLPKALKRLDPSPPASPNYRND